jgi:DHA1 family tetracycline resistance protein-like MFS transporter
VQALATRAVGAGEQGRLQGAFMSLASLCGVFAPLMYASVFANAIVPASPFYYPGAPFLLAAGIVALAFWVSHRATRPAVVPAV